MDAERWLTSELATFACAACGRAYGEGHIQLIAQREELFFVDLSCDHCGSQAVAIVTIEIDDGTPTLETGELVRADSEDSEAPRARSPVSADDVLDVHRLLDGFEGDIHRLLARLEGSEL